LPAHPQAKQIENWPLDKLIPYARNPRTHSGAQVAQIAASIHEFGFNNPILVDTGAGVIAGHGRLLAAHKLGLTNVPVIVLDHLTETQKRAYGLADNRLTLSARWDEDALAPELLELKESDSILASPASTSRSWTICSPGQIARTPILSHRSRKLPFHVPAICGSVAIAACNTESCVAMQRTLRPFPASWESATLSQRPRRSAGCRSEVRARCPLTEQYIVLQCIYIDTR